MAAMIVDTSKDASSTTNVALSLNLGASFTARYEVHEPIGKGAYAQVYRGSRRSDGGDVAVKLIDLRPIRMKENYSRDRLLREVEVMKNLSHPNIVSLEDVMWAESQDHLILIMEYAPGQELFEAIIGKGRFTEEEARSVVGGILSALDYCHAKGYVHRDVKPENIQLLSSGGVKLLDFGLSRSVGRGASAKTFAGTPEYFAPEVDPRRRVGGQNAGYGVAADCWSMGAVMYVLLSGIFPEFTGPGKDIVSFERRDYWDRVSQEAKDLIFKLMLSDPKRRITAKEALHHPWLSGGRVDGQAGATPDVEEVGKNGTKRLASKELIRAESSEVDGELDTGIASALQYSPVRASSSLAAIGSNAVVNTGDVLLQLHVRITNIFERAARESAAGGQQVPSSIVACGIACREQMEACSVAMKNLGYTADSVLDLMPDIKLAVEEGETKAAAELFVLIKEWISERKEETSQIVTKNREVMMKLGMWMSPSVALQELEPTDNADDGGCGGEGLVEGGLSISRLTSTEGDIVSTGASQDSMSSVSEGDYDMDQALDLAFHIPDGSDASFAPLMTPPRGGTRPSAEGGSEPGSSVALTMYEKLKQIDFVLQQFSRFWTTMQSNLSMLLQRNNHIQGLLRVTHNPRLRNRFFHRMKEYTQMWKLIHSTSRRYAIGMSSKHLSKCLLEGGVPQLPPVDNGLNLTQS